MGFPIALCQDNFSDGVGGGMWGAAGLIGSATIAETGGQAVVTLPSSTAGTHTGFFRTSARYDLTGDGIYWNIQTMVATGVAATAYFQLFSSDLVDQLYWRQVSNAITARTLVGGVDTQLFTATWSSSTYKYVRIREAAGTIYWDSSSNGTSWTNRASVANPFVVTDMVVQFAASCGNVASPGSLKLDDVNLILPAPSATWRHTTADWGIFNRLRPVTLAATANAQGVLVTADTMDSADVLGGTLRYFAGPLGSSSGGYLALTEYASLALAQASAFPVPVDERVDLPVMVDARYMRLYHRSTDASGHAIREFVPQRFLQVEALEAEGIRAMHISAGAVTADKIFVLTLGAITANIGKLNIDLTGYLYQGTGTGNSPTTGLKIFNSGGIGKLSTYNAGVEQVTFDTDGKLKAGGGVVFLDADGISLSAGTGATSKVKFTTSGSSLGSVHGFTGGTADDYNMSVVANGVDSSILQLVSGIGAGSANSVSLELDHTTGILVGTTGSGVGKLRVPGGINVGAATAATTGQVFATIEDSGTTTAVTPVQFGHHSSGTPAANFGVDFSAVLHSSNNTERSALLIRTSWVTATDASRAARANFFVYDTAARSAFALEASGSAAKIGVLGAGAVVRQTVTGSRAGNAALASLLSAMATFGWITDSSSA